MSTEKPIEVVQRHRRHVELSPGVGHDAQIYALAVCDDILSDLALPDAPGGHMQEQKNDDQARPPGSACERCGHAASDHALNGLGDCFATLYAAVCQCPKYVASLPSRSVQTDEIAWVIERDYSGQLMYWTGRPESGNYAWSPKHQDARRFARREDANRMLTWHLGDNGRSVEHCWSTGAPSVQTTAGSAEPKYCHHCDNWAAGVHPDHVSASLSSVQTEARVQELEEAELVEAVALIKGDPAVDREWKDETLYQAIVIMLNSLFYRRKAHEELERQLALQAEALEKLMAEMRNVVDEMRREGVNGWPNAVEGWADALSAVIASPPQESR